MAPYVPGSQAQTILDVNFIVWSDSVSETTREMGDIAYNHNSGMLMISANSDAVSVNEQGTIAICDPSSGLIHQSVAYAGSISGTGLYQLVWDASGLILMSDRTTSPTNTELRSVNTQSGYVGPTLQTLAIAFYDMAEWISQPCTP